MTEWDYGRMGTMRDTFFYVAVAAGFFLVGSWLPIDGLWNKERFAIVSDPGLRTALLLDKQSGKVWRLTGDIWMSMPLVERPPEPARRKKRDDPLAGGLDDLK